MLLTLLPVLLQGCAEKQADNDQIQLSGAFKKWHRMTMILNGPETNEGAADNPFLDYRLNIEFKNGDHIFTIPGHYAADANAAETSASKGNKWRVFFSPNAIGEWTYKVSFRKGENIAVSNDQGTPLPLDNATGSFEVTETDKIGADLRAKGLLQYVKKRYLRFAETGEYYLKGGPNSPENFLAFHEFDSTYSFNPKKKFVKSYAAHLKDWNAGDPTWQNGKGKGIIGAVNYLGSKGANSIYFLTMNVIGDSEDVWPYTSYNEQRRFDCSKLDQWEIVFSHMDKLGILMHVVTQEVENGELLDDGELGIERKLYYRELISRFAHHPAIIWNIGEETENTVAQQISFADYFKRSDPYKHPTVIHTHAYEWDKVYRPLLGHPSFDGVSFQTRKELSVIRPGLASWIKRSADHGHPWFVCVDEPGSANAGLMPDDQEPSNHDYMRVEALWSSLMAGGAGIEWYFGYRFSNSDLTCEDWRSRDRMWNYTHHALSFFQQQLPFHEMEINDDLTSAANDYCFAKKGEVYAILLPRGGTTSLDLTDHKGNFSIRWYDPRNGEYHESIIKQVKGLKKVNLGGPSYDLAKDWVILVRKID